jgi:hypothetical protein
MSIFLRSFFDNQNAVTEHSNGAKRTQAGDVAFGGNKGDACILLAIKKSHAARFYPEVGAKK